MSRNGGTQLATMIKTLRSWQTPRSSGFSSGQDVVGFETAKDTAILMWQTNKRSRRAPSSQVLNFASNRVGSIITVRVSIPRKMKRKDRSDRLETSHRRNKMQHSRITQIRHMRVVKENMASRSFRKKGECSISCGSTQQCQCWAHC